MRRTDLPPHKTATYVLPRWKLVYVSVPKAACTSLKWLLADLQGERRERFHATLSTETGRNMTVHRRARWQHTPMLHELSDADLEQITPDNGWFVFAVVRHPSARLWSGWQSKLLLREPRFAKLYPEAPWPRMPASTSDVVEEFHRFVRALDEEPDQPIFGDRHFLRQVELLRIDHTPYSRIYPTSQIPQLLDDLEKHLLPQGLDRMPELSRNNETPLRPVAAVFSAEISQIISRHYAPDFDRFGYTDPVPPALAPGDAYTAQELAEVGRLAERSERVGDLVEMATRWRSKQRTVTRQVDALRRRVADLEDQVAALEGRAPTIAEMRPFARRLLSGARRRTVRTLRDLKARGRAATVRAEPPR
jgi:hypothetical protein